MWAWGEDGTATHPPPTERPDVVRVCDARNHAGFSPLHYAVWSKQAAAVQVGKRGAEVWARAVRCFQHR